MIKLIKSSFYNENKTKKELSDFILKSNWFSFGKYCERFEKKFATYQGRKHCIFVNSGSSANLALIQSLINLGKLKPNDKIGFSAVTWSTNVMPIMQLGLQPVPIDVELNTINVSNRTLKELLKKTNIKALFLTNLLGFCDNIDEIRKTCNKQKIILIEDNCESLGSIYKQTKLGNFGLASTFSFYVGHHMSTIEGGAICTDDEDLATMLRLVRAHGWDRNLDIKRQKAIRDKFEVNSTFYSRYTFYDLGYNLRPTEIQGFLGINQLKYINQINKKRNKNFLKISSEIYKKEDLYMRINHEHMDFISNFAVPIICRSTKIRDILVAKCAGKIEIRPIVGGNIANQLFFKKYNPSNKYPTKNADIVHEQGLYFGNNPELSTKEVREIIKVFTS